MSMTVARVLAVLSAAFTALVLSGTSAMAATPATWEDGEQVSKLFVLGVLVGAPLGLFVIITALAAAVNVKAKHYSPVIPDSTDVEVSSH